MAIFSSDDYKNLEKVREILMDDDDIFGEEASSDGLLDRLKQTDSYGYAWGTSSLVKICVLINSMSPEQMSKIEDAINSAECVAIKGYENVCGAGSFLDELLENLEKIVEEI
jgi:hypothetical protein